MFVSNPLAGKYKHATRNGNWFEEWEFDEHRYNTSYAD